MYDLGRQFHIDNKKLISKNEAIIRGQKYRFTVLTERLIRLEYSPNGVFNDFATELVSFRDFDVPKFTKKEDKNFLEITTSYFKLTYTKEMPFKGGFLTPEKNLKVESVKKSRGNVTWYYGHEEVRNRFGSNISAETEMQKKAQNRGLFSEHGMVSFDDSNSLVISENGEPLVNSTGEIDVYLFMYDNDFGLCVNDYFKLTGLPSLIPRYALGNWWCRDLPYNSSEVAELVTNFERFGIPLSVFLFDKQWHVSFDENKESGFSFNTGLIPDPKGLIDALHSYGIRVGLAVNPFAGFYPGDFNYEKIKSFLEYQGNGLIEFDPLNPRLLDCLLKCCLAPLEELGVDFFWNNSNKTNDLHRLWIINHYLFNDLARNPAKRGMILSRNSLKAAHLYPVLYAGESKVSWENFMSTPFFNLSASNIGVCWWSHDIGGYTDGIEDPELYIRSVQLGVFSPILRFHSSGGKYYKREPWRWDNHTFTIVGNYLRLRHRLTSYLYTEAYRYSKTGAMIFQPLYYYLPEVYDDPVSRNEYYFGSELLVAPIVSKKDPVMNRTIHRFFLPRERNNDNGMWFEFTTGKKYIGNKKYTSFYKEEDYPIFAKRGSIIPLSNRSNVNNTSNPTDLEIHVFPGCNNTYRMYEDDGISSLYKEGYYLITEIDYNYLPNNYTLIIRSVEGKSGIVPDKRNYKIRFRNTKRADDVIVYFDSTQIQASNTYNENNDFIVEINEVSTVGQLTINCKGKDIEVDAVRVINEDIDSILSDLQIETKLKEKIADILFSNEASKDKRIKIRKLKRYLDKSFITLFLKLIDYVEEFG